MKLKKNQANLGQKIIIYRHKYLNRFSNLGESDTRVIVNHLLTDVLGYSELVDFKTEYRVLGGYVDYLVEHNGKKLFVVEVKSLDTKLKFRHLKQALYYALSVGVKLVVLTNAREVKIYEIYRIRPLKIRSVASIDLLRNSQQDKSELYKISKKFLKQKTNLTTKYNSDFLDNSTLRSHF